MSSVGDLYERLHEALEIDHKVEGQHDGLLVRDSAGRLFAVHVLDLTEALNASKVEGPSS